MLSHHNSAVHYGWQETAIHLQTSGVLDEYIYEVKDNYWLLKWTIKYLVIDNYWLNSFICK